MIKIKELRQKKGINQAELAKVFGVSQQTISSYEKGIREPDIETLNNLSDFFNVSLDYLLGKTNIPDTVETLALSRKDGYEDDLPEEAKKEIENFKEFIKQKYSQNK